jgi:hypothetical protein
MVEPVDGDQVVATPAEDRVANTVRGLQPVRARSALDSGGGRDRGRDEQERERDEKRALQRLPSDPPLSDMNG